MSWLLDDDAVPAPAGATPFERVFGLRANLLDDFRRFYALFWEQRLVDPVILELCRLRVAQIHGCEAELRVRYQPALDAGLTEAKIAALAQAGESPLFSEAERACVSLAELFAMDPHAVTDADAARVTAVLGDAGTVALVEALALFDGFARFRLILGVDAPDAQLTAPAPRAAGPVY